MTNQDFSEHVSQLIGALNSLDETTTVESTDPQTFPPSEGPSRTTDSYYVLIHGYTDGDCQARMFVDFHEVTGVLYLVTPPGVSLLSTAPIEDRSEAINTFAELMSRPSE